MKKLIVCFLVLWTHVGLAEASSFKEGQHYQQLPVEMLENELVEDLKKEHPDQIIVLEFFSYGCHWCYQLEPKVADWSSRIDESKVVFKRFPVVFQSSWANLSKAYFTGEALELKDKVHHALFEAIQTETLKSTAPDVLQSFFAKQGVEELQFAKTFDSFSVEQQFKRANQISIAFRITAIPAFVVYGPKGAVITSARMAGGEDELFKVLDLLLNEQRALSLSKNSD